MNISNRAFIWLFLILAVAVFFQLRQGGFRSGGKTPASYDMYRLPAWKCRWLPDKACVYHRAGIRFELATVKSDQENLQLTATVPDKHAIGEIRFRLAVSPQAAPEQELFFKKTGAGKWRLELSLKTFSSSPEKKLIIWLLSGNKIVQVELIKQK